jgi:hypothetical protein
MAKAHPTPAGACSAPSMAGPPLQVVGWASQCYACCHVCTFVGIDGALHALVLVAACPGSCPCRGGPAILGVSSAGLAATNIIVLQYLHIYCTSYCISSSFNVIHALIQLHPAIAVAHPRGHWIVIRVDGRWTPSTGPLDGHQWTLTGCPVDEPLP